MYWGWKPAATKPPPRLSTVPVENGAPNGGGRILANQVLSQIETHAPYGGVVPELAARAHLSHLDGLIAAALNQAEHDFA
jgi:N6-L-threonylcarbamoyladenine synthase